MKLISLNLSLPRTIDHQGETILTGIFKTPIFERVQLHTLGLEGDGQADLRVHGGVDKAVYLYPSEHYAYWQEVLTRTNLTPGQFGENFTVEGLLETNTHLGDTFRVGTAIIQITQPRYPCYKLGIKMGRKDFPKLFWQSEFSGFYARVLAEGHVGAGDAIEPLHLYPENPTIQATYQDTRRKVNE
ncbi:MAG TPA: MOSC domain-containing protein [Anaerolineales bacterium]|nr:MOSC domain-containing protein [Anaerolineales bacterium]